MKKVLSIFIIAIFLLNTTGCLNSNVESEMVIYTTAYPIQYITNYLYGKNSTINSIYPNSVNINTYKLTEKQIQDYSKCNIYIFNGLTKEKDYVTKMFDYNKNLKIIDASANMNFSYNQQELWLDPSNFLMLALNIKNGLLEYIDNYYLQNEIENNYNNLKLEISNLDASFMKMYNSSDKTTIVVDNDVFRFLEKYGFKVISLDPDTITEKTIADINNLALTKSIKYIFTSDESETNDVISTIASTYNIQLLQLKTLDTISSDEASNNNDYLQIMQENLSLLKNELYN